MQAALIVDSTYHAKHMSIPTFLLIICYQTISTKWWLCGKIYLTEENLGTVFRNYLSSSRYFCRYIPYLLYSKTDLSSLHNKNRYINDNEVNTAEWSNDWAPHYHKISTLHHTRGVASKRVTSDGIHLRSLAPGQHSSEETSQRWRAVGVRFEPKIKLKTSHADSKVLHRYANPLLNEKVETTRQPLTT